MVIKGWSPWVSFHPKFKPNFLNLQHIQLITKTTAWVAKQNHLGKLDPVVVTVDGRFWYT
jgi:hypothetical protein